MMQDAEIDPRTSQRLVVYNEERPDARWGNQMLHVEMLVDESSGYLLRAFVQLHRAKMSQPLWSSEEVTHLFLTQLDEAGVFAGAAAISELLDPKSTDPRVSRGAAAMTSWTPESPSSPASAAVRARKSGKFAGLMRLHTERNSTRRALGSRAVAERVSTSLR